MGSDDHNRIRVPARIGNWMLEQNLGSGYSGSIWRATNPYTGQRAAIKVQDVDHECPTNRYERNFYPSLQGGKGMPTLWAAGVQGEYDYLVIDLLGPSLDSLYRKNGRKFGLKSTICLAMQVISRLEFMHSRGILHRDIQLGNCVLGLGQSEKVIYMIDFGFSKRYIDPHTRRHIPDSRAKRDFIGNYWFSSVNVHCRGRVPTRRDDMEALALMLVHVLTEGGLPWTRNGIPKTDKAHDILVRKKLKARPEDLCYGLPPVFEDFLRYCRRLKFFEQPDYRYWRDQFADLAREMGYVEQDGSVSDDFEWPPPPDEVPPPYRKRIAPNRDDSNHEVDIMMILEEIAKMRLEKTGLVKVPAGNGPLIPQLAAAEVPRMVPGAWPSSNDPKSDKPVPKLHNWNGKGDSGTNTNTDNGDTRSDSSESKDREPKHRPGVIVISDSSSESETTTTKPSRQLDRATKQATMRLLTKRARAAAAADAPSSDSGALVLADLLRKFLETYALTGTRSRVITRDAFEFLDTLVQKLDDSGSGSGSGSGHSDRNNRTAHSNSKSDTNESAYTHRTEGSRLLRQRACAATQTQTQAQKAETVKSLRQRIQASPRDLGHDQLAKILGDFCQAVRSTTGKTLTKDGVAFLEGVESRLRLRSR